MRTCGILVDGNPNLGLSDYILHFPCDVPWIGACLESGNHPSAYAPREDSRLHHLVLYVPLRMVPYVKPPSLFDSNQFPLAYQRSISPSTMAFKSDYTGTSIDQLGQHQHQDQSQSQYSLQSELLNTYLHPQSQSQFNHWSSPALSYEYGSRGTSAQIISPTSDVIGEMATTSDEGHQVQSTTKELESSQSYGYNLDGQGHGHGHGQPSNSFASTSSSFQTDFGCNGNVDHIYPINNDFTSPLSSLNGNLYPIPDLNFQNREFLSCDLDR